MKSILIGAQVVVAMSAICCHCEAFAVDILEYPSVASSAAISTSNVEDIHRGAVAYMKAEFGGRRTKQIEDWINAISPSTKVVAACGASLRKAGQTDVALSLVDFNKGTIRYAIAYEEGKKLEILVTSFAEPSAAGGLPKTPSVRCESWTGVERINRSIQRQMVATTPVDPLKVISKQDAVCIAPINSDFDYRCFSHTSGSKLPVDIGGWRNN